MRSELMFAAKGNFKRAPGEFSVTAESEMFHRAFVLKGRHAVAETATYLITLKSDKPHVQSH